MNGVKWKFDDRFRSNITSRKAHNQSESTWNRVRTTDAFSRTARVLDFESSFKWHTILFLMLFCSNLAHFSEIQLVCDRRTDRRSDGRTDGRTDRRTDIPSYRDARTHLKRNGTWLGEGRVWINNESLGSTDKRVWIIDIKRNENVERKESEGQQEKQKSKVCLMLYHSLSLARSYEPFSHLTFGTFSQFSSHPGKRFRVTESQIE